MSARFNPAARTRTPTRSRVADGGLGTTRNSRASTPPNETMVTAFIEETYCTSKEQKGAWEFLSSLTGLACFLRHRTIVPAGLCFATEGLSPARGNRQ